MADINVTEQIIDINVTEEVVNIISPSGGYPLPTNVISVFGRSGVVLASEGDYTITQLGDVTLTSPANGQVLKYNGTQWVNSTDADTGITTLNTLTALSQSFATGTSGTDFAISSSTATHTFNLPIASATNTGKLSSTDWTTFNNKQAALNGTGFVKISGTTISYDNTSYLPLGGGTLTGGLSGTTATFSGILTTPQVKAATSAGLSINANSGTQVADFGAGGSANITFFGGLSGTSASFSSSITGNTIVKSGGTAAQILAADGSVITAGTNITISGGTISSTSTGMAIGGSITSATAGSVLFAGTSGVLQQDNANLFWDDTNNRLGIGTASPASTLDIRYSGTAQQTMMRIFSPNQQVGAVGLGNAFSIGVSASNTNAAEWLFDYAGSGSTSNSQGFGFYGSAAFFRLYASNVVAISMGNVVPTSKMQINGNAAIGYSTATAAPSNGLAINGNTLIGTTTDSGFRLDVNGTARVQGNTTISTGDLTVSTGTTISSSGFRLAVDLNADLGTSSIRFFRSYIDTMNTRLVTTSGNVTAASAIARGVYILNNLTAAANSDVLVGLDIAPNFNNGAFTSVRNYSARFSGNVSIGSKGLFCTNTQYNTLYIGNSSIQGFNSAPQGDLAYISNGFYNGTNTVYTTNGFSTFFSQDSLGRIVFFIAPSGTAGNTISFTQAVTLFNTGNLAIGTTTDAGFKLDVNGADARINGVTIGRGGGNNASNTAIGSNALNLNLSGLNNVAVGFESLRKTTSNNNVGIGHTALTNQTSGTSNVAVGTAAISGLTTGSRNIGIGVQALNTITTQSDNIAIGDSAMFSATGTFSVAIGGNTLRSNTTSSNIAIGANALKVTTSGANNTAVGTNAMENNTTGANNFALGTAAFINNTTGSKNIAIGVEASRFISGGSTASTIQNNSIFIGELTKPLADNQTNQIVIGYNETGLGSNTTVIGNSSTTFGRWWGRLLLGTSTDAGFGLDVNGTARVQDRLTIVKSELGTFDGVSVQNTNNGYTTVIRAKDNSTGFCEFGLGGTSSAFPNEAFFYTNKSNLDFYANADRKLRIFGATGNVLIQTGGTFTDVASSILTINSTTKGFLPPRMTTAEKNAIATPAAGLIVYDTTLNKLCVFTTAWETITSL
jgi:hypothetical protein